MANFLFETNSNEISIEYLNHALSLILNEIKLRQENQIYRKI